MYQGKKVGVVVPAYNEEKLIGPTLETIPAFVDRIYMIDDGSTDATPEVIRRFTDPRFLPSHDVLVKLCVAGVPRFSALRNSPKGFEQDLGLCYS